jgi:anaerobic selenocysteine-containing dehydrogenase
VTDATRAGVAVIEGIWWHRFHPGGRGVNFLTDDRTTDLGGGPALHSNMVEVTRVSGAGAPTAPESATAAGR